MKTLEETIEKVEQKRKTLKQRLGRRTYVKSVTNYVVMQLSSSKEEIRITDAGSLVQLYKFLSHEIEMDFIKEEFLLFVVQSALVRSNNDVLLRIPKNNAAYKRYVLRKVVKCFYKDIWM